jgi:hypothetical protein
MSDPAGNPPGLPKPDLADLAHTNPPPWGETALQAVTKDRYLDLKHFLSRRHRSTQGVVTLGEVSCFVSGVGDLRLSWDALLHVCIRQRRLEPTHWDPDYWLTSRPKHGLGYVAVGDDLLVTRGLHRTVLARYALHYRDADTLYGVEVSRWSLDWTLYDTWVALQKICREELPHLAVVPERRKVGETCDGHWVVEEYLSTLRRQDRRSGETRVLGAAEARDWLAELDRDGRYGPALHAAPGARPLAA